MKNGPRQHTSVTQASVLASHLSGLCQLFHFCFGHWHCSPRAFWPSPRLAVLHLPSGPSNNIYPSAELIFQATLLSSKYICIIIHNYLLLRHHRRSKWPMLPWTAICGHWPLSCILGKKRLEKRSARAEALKQMGKELIYIQATVSTHLPARV